MNRLEKAHIYEDSLVSALNTIPDFTAGLYGNRNNSPDVQDAMRKDVEGYLLVRNNPDIYLNVNGLSYFIDAKDSHHARTGNHLVDVDAEEALIAHEEFSNRPSLLAFQHTDGRTGWMNMAPMKLSAIARQLTSNSAPVLVSSA
jgi:hypothetical protein